MQTDVPPESHINDRRQEWLLELSDRDYRRCVDLIEELVGIPYRFSPGATATALLRQLHVGGKKMLPAVMPPPALDPSTEGDLKWVRPLTAVEQAAPYIVCLDVNAAYLAAMSALRAGVGAPQYIHTPPRSWEFSGTAPVGYHRLPCGWVTTITLDRMTDRDRDMTGPIFESWVWDETSRPLEPFYKVVRDARAYLLLRRWDTRWTVVADAALMTVKHMYTDLIGRFASTKWDRSDDAMFRPDIRHYVIATRRTRVQRIMASCDPAPFAANCDALYFATEASPAVQGLRMGTNPGSWKISGCVRHVDAVRAATEGGNLSQLVELVR